MSINEIKEHEYFRDTVWDRVLTCRVLTKSIKKAKSSVNSQRDSSTPSPHTISAASQSMASSPIASQGTSLAQNSSKCFFTSDVRNLPDFESNAPVANPGHMGQDAEEPQIEEVKVAIPQARTPMRDRIALEGTLRKKGLLFFNERRVSLNPAGMLCYYHFNRPNEAKGNINLAARVSNIISINFTYARSEDADSAAASRAGHFNDEFSVQTESQLFIFRASKTHQQYAHANPSIGVWE